MIMVFGNNLIDFSANGMVAAQVDYPATTSALQSTIGQDFIMPDLNPHIPPTGDTTPKKILPLEIKKTYTGLTFTVELDGDNYMGCGPQDSNGDDYNMGRACVAYPVDMSKSAGEIKSAIESKLLEFLKKLRETEKAQKEYEEAQAQWEQDKANCDSEVKEGSTFRFVNEDRNYSEEEGPPTESWICQETIYPVEEEDTTETEDEEESTSDSVVVAQTTTPIETASTNLSIGFSQGLKQTFRRGFLVGGILLVGYGGVKFEERTNFFSKMFKGKKKTPKTNATPKTDTTPKTTEANA